MNKFLITSIPISCLLCFFLLPLCANRSIPSKFQCRVRGCSTSTFGTHLFNQSVFLFLQTFNTSLHPNCKTWGAETFQRMFTPHHVCNVMCQVSHIRSHLSGVTCQVYCLFSFLFFSFSDKVVELVGGASVFNESYPVQFI